jgi:hypothetical protein
MKKFFGILILLLSTVAFAQEDSRSVGWQKVMLEQTLQERVHAVVGAFAKDEHFVSRVDVVASRLKPNSRASMNTLSLGKLDMLAPGLPTRIEESNDVFTYIEKVNVTLTVSKTLLDQHKADLERLLTQAISPVTQTPVAVTLEAFPETKPEEAKKPEARSWQEIFEANSLTFALVAMAALMALLFVRLMNLYQNVEAKKLDQMASTSGAAQSPAERGEEKRQESGTGKSPGRIPAIDPNLTAQIQSIVTAYPQKIPALVRRWLSSDNEKSNEGLWILPKLLPMNAMVHLAAQLDDTAKRAWRSVLEEPSPSWSELSAQEFVSHELIDDVLRQSFPLADDLRQLLDGVKTDEIAELAAKDVKQGALLINILSTSQSARVLTLLPTDVRTQVVLNCPAIEFDDVVKMTPLIRQELQRLRRKSDVVTVPFTERALELVREVGPELESDIFDSLAYALPRAELMKTLRNMAPAEAILDAEPRFHRQCLTAMTLAQRADLIFASPPDRQKLLLGAFPDGEKVRELLDAEIAMFEHDQQRAAKARREADRLWRQYLQNCRRLVQSDEAVAEMMKPVLNRWIDARAHGEKRNAA